MKKLTKIFAIMFIITSFSMVLSACSRKSSEIPYAYVSIDINTFQSPKNNPKVEFVINKRELVIRAIPRNIEAEMVLSVLSALEWRDYKDAIEIFIDTATELGFIYADAFRTTPNRVIITAVGAEDEDTGEVREESVEAIEKYMKKNGIWCDIFVDYMFDNLSYEAKKFNTAAARLRLVNSVQMVKQSLSTEDALKLTNKELMILINGKEAKTNLKELHQYAVESRKSQHSTKYALKGDKEKTKELNDQWGVFKEESQSRLESAMMVYK